MPELSIRKIIEKTLESYFERNVCGLCDFHCQCHCHVEIFGSRGCIDGIFDS